MTLKKKMLAAFFTMVILLILVATYSYTAIGMITSNIETLLSNTKELRDVAGIQLTVQKALMPANDFLITNDIAEKGNFERLVEDLEQRIAKGRENNLTEQERTVFNQLEQRLSVLKQQGQDIFSSKEKGSVSAAQGAAMEKFDAVGDEISKIGEELDRIIVAELDSATDQSLGILKTTRLALITLSLLVVVTGLLISLGMTRSLMKVLGGEPKEIGEIAARLAVGDLTSK